MTDPSTTTVSIRIELSGQLKDRAGQGSVSLSVDSLTTPEAILNTFCSYMTEPVREFCLTSESKPRTSLLFCLNEEQRDWNESLHLSDGDRVQLFSAISGG